MSKPVEVTPLNHLVIIPDGNRRWAKAKGLPAWEGHRQGANNTKQILEFCRDNNIKVLTMWGFSTENWKRDPKEVEFLMGIFRDFLKNRREEFIKNKVKFRHIGRKDRLAPDLMELITSLEEDTKDFTEWMYQVGLDYGGQDEIVRATQRVAEAVQKGEIKTEELTTDTFKQYLDTRDAPPPDFIIRTSGEQRLSGIMPYQSVYAELLFVPVMFPDLNKKLLQEIVEQYYERQRRFGGG